MKLRNSFALAAVLSVCLVPVASASLTFDIDVTGIDSWDLQGDSDNVVLNIDAAAAAGLLSGTSMHVIGIGWNVTIATVATISWLSEITAGFSDDGTVDYALTPGAGDEFEGVESYSSGGIMDLVGGGNDFFLPTGNLIVEFYETFVDLPNGIDGEWRSGTFTLEVERTNPIPVPGAVLLGMVGFGLFGASRKFRNRRA